MRNYPMFKKFFISFVVFLIIPVIILCSISDYMILRYSEREISKSSLGKLKVAGNISSQLTDQISRDALQMSMSKNLYDLNNYRRYDQIVQHPDSFMYILKLMDTLSEMPKANKIINSVYLYVDEADYIVTSNSRIVLLDSEFVDTGWIQEYKKMKGNKFTPFWLEPRFIQYQGKGSASDNTLKPEDNILTYVYPLTMYTSYLNGAIIINVYEQELSQLINSNNTESEGYMYIISERGDVISSADKNLFGKNIADQEQIKNIISNESKEGYIISNVNNDRSLVTYYKSDLNDWIYVGVFSLDTLMSKVISVCMSVVYSSVLLVVIGTGVSFILSKRLYNPVKKLIQDLKKKSGLDFNNTSNEIILLEKVFDTLVKQEENLFNELEKQKINVRENYLRRLLEGNLKNMESYGFLETKFSRSHFLCVVISIDRYVEFSQKYSEEQQYYMKALILKVSEEIFNISYTGAGLVINQRKIAIVINMNCIHAEEAFRQIEADVRKMQMETSKVLDFTVSVGIGNMYTDKQGVKKSFQEAEQALKLKLFSGDGSVIVWKEDLDKYNKYYYPYEKETRILNVLKWCLKEALSAAVDDLIDDIRNKNGISCDNILQIINQLVGNTIRFLVDSHINISDIFGANFNIYHDLSERETLEDYGKFLHAFYGSIVEYLSKPILNSKGYFAQMLEYIHTNYKTDIGIDDIAAQVGLSYAHTRKIFKDETGDSLIDYINKLRIEEAKGLLCKSNKNIMDIALKLGYNNDQSFTRFFRKYVGVTPGEYRNLKILI